MSCADSRVVPELAFDTGLSKFFVVRAAGNIAHTDSIASIEYAVAHCGSKVIVVLNHQSCGAVTAAIGGGGNGYNLNHLLGQITPAINTSRTDGSVNDVVKKNAQLAAKDLSNRSSIIKNALDNNDISIVPGYYNLDSGRVDFL